MKLQLLFFISMMEKVQRKVNKDESGWQRIISIKAIISYEQKTLTTGEKFECSLGRLLSRLN